MFRTMNIVDSSQKPGKKQKGNPAGCTEEGNIWKYIQEKGKEKVRRI